MRLDPILKRIAFALPSQQKSVATNLALWAVYSTRVGRINEVQLGVEIGHATQLY